jgi:hypothetical protein
MLTARVIASVRAKDRSDTRLLVTAESVLLLTKLVTAGTAMVTVMDITAIVTNSSMSVNPVFLDVNIDR